MKAFNYTHVFTPAGCYSILSHLGFCAFLVANWSPFSFSEGFSDSSVQYEDQSKSNEVFCINKWLSELMFVWAAWGQKWLVPCCLWGEWANWEQNLYLISGSVFLFSFCLSFIFPSAKSKLNLLNPILLRNPISATACRALLSHWLLIVLLWECFSWALSVTE